MRDLEMAFLGKIAASMTHEIKNTFAIILESSGLLSDIITFSPEGSMPSPEKFQRVLGNINQQVNRGVDITTRLNQFAHSMDEPLTVVQLPDLLQLMVLLMRRLAKRRSVELQAVSAGGRTITTDPFRLLLVLGSVIDQLADALEGGGEIILQLPDTSPGTDIFLEIRGNLKPEWKQTMENLFATLQEVLEVLRAELRFSAAPVQAGVILHLSTS